MAIIPNMKLIEAKTVSSAVNTVVFSSIPQTYTDLKLVCSAQSQNSGVDAIRIRPNGSSSNMYTRFLQADITGTSGSVTSENYPFALTRCNGNDVANVFGSGEYYIANYTSTTLNKAIWTFSTSESSGQRMLQNMSAALWSDTTAITSITLITESNANFSNNSTFYLYGISSSAVSGTKATGGVIYSDATYFYHAFPTSGTFTPTQSISCDYIVIGGGGGGGGIVGGGGGAGQVASYTSQSLSATGYAVTIGAGGTSPAIATLGTNGTSTTFASNTAIGGGGGGAYNGQNGANGASGGGGGGSEPANANAAGGTGTAGFNGGAGTGFGIGSTYAGGGGGGAGGVGANAVQPSGGVDNSSIAGNGGIGATSSLINAIALATGYGQYNAGNYYIAAGGGGASGNALTNIGFGGIGGGGNGGANEPGTRGTNGLANTGSGGGGARDNLGGNGAAGLVVIRYAK
jgi:hypothetical protein